MNDNFLVQASEITSYNFSSYEGEVEFELDEQYNVPRSEISVFELNSKSSAGTIEKIKAAYIGNIGQINADTVILICEEGTHHMDYYFPRIEALYHNHPNHNIGILILDYKGIGLSTGTFTIEEMTNDVQAGIKWLQDRNLTTDRFVMYAHGLGSTPCYTAASFNSVHDSLLHPSKIILENPIASSETLVSNTAQFNLPPSYFTASSFDNVILSKESSQDLLLLTSENNKLYKPEQNGEVIFEHHASIQKQKVMAEKADHTELITVITPTRFQDLILDFIKI